MSQLIIFDWDWTLARPESGETFRKPGESYVWMNGQGRHNCKELLEWLAADNHVAITTNQGGISYGIVEWAETEQAIWKLLKDLDQPIPLLLCPYHERFPERYPMYSSWRKPLPGMLLTAHRLFPQVPPEEVLVVGDRPEDERAALNAGFAYEDQLPFFARIENDLEHFITQEQTVGESFGELDNMDEPPF